MSLKFNIKFLNDLGDFELENPEKFKRLYFPLLNEAGLISSITPDLKGDIKTSQHSFLTIPVTVEDLYLTKSSRNFWALINGKKAWSATGVSGQENKKQDKVKLEAGLLWHRIIRENKELKIRSIVTNFVPSSGEQVELMKVDLTNLSAREMKITGIFSLPLFCRSAENLRDHRNVTSMLNRITVDRYGIVSRPTMLFNEAGHRLNHTFYFVRGFSEKGQAPSGVFPTVMDFLGETGDFENPEAVLLNKKPARSFQQGEENVAGIKFKEVELKPRQSVSFILVMGITEEEKKIREWSERFNAEDKFNKALDENKKFWTGYSNRIKFRTRDEKFNNWIRWVSIQPLLRKIAGNSFMPDFDYGKGGRGWRDLWQDLLALILVNPEEIRPLLISNFEGVRIDGSNATVIGKGKGEFVADRNNVTRVWMDHGIWPFFTTRLYIHQTGDRTVLFEKQKYFKDRQIKRAGEKDEQWDESQGKNLRTGDGRVYEGTVLEHILVQHLVQFFNVGEHNNIRLEDADWNDGLDMAHKKGESVAFTAFYAGNLGYLAELLENVKETGKGERIFILEELSVLLDTLGEPVDYDSASKKQVLLDQYLERTGYRVSGRTIEIPLDDLKKDLRRKSEWLREHIRKNEWIRVRSGEEWFNGYYDNEARRVEGDNASGVRMTLTGQVFPVLFGIADEDKTQRIMRSVMRYLWDKGLKGLRLNTDFNEVKLDLGRAFGFAYGNKENGAFFSHMNVMMAYALYEQGFAREGALILSSIFRMWQNHNMSRIYPGIPEYFNNLGRGYYHYLTGSASWYVFTLLTQVFGVRGDFGDLCFAPALMKEQFNRKAEAFCETTFAGQRMKIVYRNKKNLDHPAYKITRVMVNERPVEFSVFRDRGARILRRDLLKIVDKGFNIIKIELDGK